MNNEESCCCGSTNADPEQANRLMMGKLTVMFRWVARGAALYFALLIVAQWVMFFSAPAPAGDYRWGLLSSLAYLVLGVVSWSVFTALSLIMYRLLILPTASCGCGEGK